MNIDQQKQQLRTYITERLSKLPEKVRTSESRSICRRILQQLPEGPVNAAVYYPMKSEADILPLIEELLRRGSILFMSRAEGKGFEFRQFASLMELIPGPFRIPEPRADTPLLEKSAVQYVLVPGMAFDRACNRLGRGNGGYDRWLSRLREANPHVKIFGIALERQIVNAVPVLPHDQPMDAVIAARETYLRGQAPAA